MKILYVGSSAGTSAMRARALIRLGHEVRIIDPYNFLDGKVVVGWASKTGSFGISGIVERRLKKIIDANHPDINLIIVDNGELLTKRAVVSLKSRGCPVVCLNLDNPFTPRDGRRWRLLLDALPVYDAFFTPRDTTVASSLQLGIRNAYKIWQAADEVYHRSEIYKSFNEREYDLAFVGTWMPERGPWVEHLIKSGLPLKIFGPRWNKAPEFPKISSHTLVKTLSSQEYADTIRKTKIALIFLSSGNQDLHTTRTMEIPALGAVICAPRTSDHLQLYKEDAEAIFWSDIDECAYKCRQLLKTPARMEQIAKAGAERNMQNGNFNQQLMAFVIGKSLGTLCGLPR